MRTSTPTLFGALAGLFVSVLFCGCAPDNGGDIALRAKNVPQDRRLSDAPRPADVQSLTLDQAVSLALQYNLDMWLATQQEAIQREIKTATFLKMLPQLTFDFNAETRDSYNASSSVGLFTGSESQLNRYSYSSDKSHAYGGIRVLWNAVDFGVTYFRARQEQNRQKHAGQDARRTRQKLALDVATAYWQCVTAEKVSARARTLQEDLDKELTAIATSVKNGQVPESAGLERSYVLKSQNVKISEYVERDRAARLNLLHLMGLPLDANVSLAPQQTEGVAEKFDANQLEETALHNRPELYQEDLMEKITRDEARAVLVGMAPSTNLFLNPTADSNSYLYYNSWFNMGLNVGWNLLDIPGRFKEVQANKKRAEFVQKKRMAVAAAVITQVHLAVIEHDFAAERCRMLESLSMDSDKIVQNLEKSAASGKAKPSAVIAQKARGLDDFARYMDTFTRVMTAKARVLNSAGLETVTSLPAAYSDAGAIPAAPRPVQSTGAAPIEYIEMKPADEKVSVLPQEQPQPEAEVRVAVSAAANLAVDPSQAKGSPAECEEGVVYVVGPKGELIPKKAGKNEYVLTPAKADAPQQDEPSNQSTPVETAQSPVR